MAKQTEKNISCTIDDKISEDFKSQCERHGRIQYRAVESAIRLWINLPNEVRDRLISSDNESLDSIFEILRSRLQEDFDRNPALGPQSPKPRAKRQSGSTSAGKKSSKGYRS